MTYKKLQIVSFLIFLLAVFVLALRVVWPYINVLAFAVIITVMFNPLYQRFLRKVKSPSVASMLTVSVILLILIIPLWLFGQVIFNEAYGLYFHYKDADITSTDGVLLSRLSPAMQATATNVINQIGSTVDTFTSHAFQTLSGLLSNVLGFFLSLFLFFFTVYFLLRDGEHIKQVIMDISPIAKEQEDVLFKKIAVAVNGVIKGAFLTALVQGSAATVGFLIFGVPQPFLWGLFTVLAALVPTVGTSLSLIPAVAYLFITGNTIQAIGLAIWGALAVGLIDNLVGPKFIGSKTKLHPLLVFVSVLGGVQLFGYIGFLLGPIVMAIFVALLEMYRTDFKDYLES